MSEETKMEFKSKKLVEYSVSAERLADLDTFLHQIESGTKGIDALILDCDTMKGKEFAYELGKRVMLIHEYRNKAAKLTSLFRMNIYRIKNEKQ